MQYLYQEAEKLIKDIYWKETHDPHSKLNLSKVIEERLVKDNKEKDPDYYDHREGAVAPEPTLKTPAAKSLWNLLR